MEFIFLIQKNNGDNQELEKKNDGNKEKKMNL